MPRVCKSRLDFVQLPWWTSEVEQAWISKRAAVKQKVVRIPVSSHAVLERVVKDKNDKTRVFKRCAAVF